MTSPSSTTSEKEELLGRWDGREGGERVYRSLIEAYEVALPDHHHTRPGI